MLFEGFSIQTDSTTCILRNFNTNWIFTDELGTYQQVLYTVKQHKFSRVNMNIWQY